MTVINTNVGALQARVASLGAQTNMEKAMQRLSSGLRINSAADDAAGLAVATKMESQLRGINMAIRNSNDGISLVQTAESGMAEISNMVIRMRELAVQMNNGIYSDGDRANAQLEVEALLAEINKISDNTAFNGVKVLDGSYAQDIRAGNTNPEVINVKIDRMNTDTLGGVSITLEEADAVDTSTTYVHGSAKTHVTANEGQVTLSKEQFNENFREFTIANAGGTYTGSGTDAAIFSVNATTGQVTVASGELDFDNPSDANRDNKYHFTVSYTVGSDTISEEVELTITDRAAVTASSTTGTSALTVTEAETVSFTAAGAAGALSDAFKEFVAADDGLGSTTASYALDGDDAKAYAAINLDRLQGLAASDVMTFSANTGGGAETFTYTLTNGDVSAGSAVSDTLGAAIVAASNTAGNSYSAEYDSTTNTLVLRHDTAGASWTGTPTFAIDNSYGYNSATATTIAGAATTDFSLQNGGAALITVDSTTGKITAGTGVLDFENPLDKGFNNGYDFTVTYTDSHGKTFAETVVLTVTDDANSDRGTASQTVELSMAGRSDVNISKTNFATGVFDLGNANHRDLLSQGAKDFIERHAGAAVNALGELKVNVATAFTGTQSASAAVTSRTANTKDAFLSNSSETNTTAAALAFSSATTGPETIELAVDNANGDTITLTTAALGAGATAADVVTALKADGDYAGADFTLSLTAANLLVVTWDSQFGDIDNDISDDITLTFNANGGGGTLQNNAAALGFDGDTDTGTATTMVDGAGPAKILLDQDISTGTVIGTVTLTDDGANETFTETITFNVTQNAAAGTDTFVSGSGRTEQTHAQTTLNGTSDGEAVVLDLKDRSLFTDMRSYFDANSGGTFELFQSGSTSTAYSKSDRDNSLPIDAEGSQVPRGFELSGSELTLDAGADAGTYNATVVYTDLDGQTFRQDVVFTTTAAGNNSSATAVLTSSSQTQNATATATELTGAKSVLEVAEARTGKIASVGQNTQLSAELGQFVGRHAKGTWSLSGADAANFSIDKNGNVESRGIMNFEEKQSHSFNVVYTSGDISYSEQITLNVVNNTADDGDHIANVDVGTQAGAADAISILDDALNSITASQAKLGSIQNRLQHNIDNLTALSSQTETARGRITDADYAAETSQLSKQQILSQAATSMLAQANQSKQGVLALLQ